MALLLNKISQAQRKRTPPALDDKIITSWNSLALIALSEAARYLERGDYLEVARQTASFLLTELHSEDRLLRTWRKGTAQQNAFLEDYAGLVLGLVDLYQSDPDLRWYNTALGFVEEMNLHFQDPRGGFFDVRHDQSDILFRPKDLQDNATPCGNSLAASSLLQIAVFSGRMDLRNWAVFHCNDWQTGLVPTYLRSTYRVDPEVVGAGVLFTVHNLGYHGLFKPAAMAVVPT